MNSNDNFTHNCMFWLAEISGYQRHIVQIRTELEKLKTKFTEEKYYALRQHIQTALSKLKTTENCIIYIISENTKCAFNNHLAEVKLAMNDQNDLFEIMKSNYNLFIELQKSFHYYLKENSEPKQATKIIQFQSDRMPTGMQKMIKSSLSLNTAETEIR